MNQTPSIGRIVHFNDEGGPYPALITKVNADGTLELTTFGSNSIYFQHCVPAASSVSEPPEFRTWSWPPRI